MPTLPAEIAQEFAELRATQPGGSLHLLALVDCAFDEEFLDNRYRRTQPPQSLYDNTALQQFGAAAPHLLTSPEGEGESLAWLTHLFASCGNKPMLSIIASSLDADELARHMRPYLIAMTHDTVEWPVRWGDTRVLPALLAALTESQRSHFLGPVARWWSPARDGGLLRWDGADELPGPTAFDKLPLGDEVFASLVDTAEADAVLASLYDSQPDLFHTCSPAECHSRVVRHLHVASCNGILAASAREHFSALALLLNDDFTQHEALVRLLMRTREGADYKQELAALPDEFWRVTER
jgi:hypothetical protein